MTSENVPRAFGRFLLGFALAATGAYLLTSNITVTSGYWYLWGHNVFHLTVVPLFLGLAILFYDARLRAGWLLTVAGAAILLAAILTNLHAYFRPTSLFNTLLMLGLLGAGLGLMARSIRAQGA